MSDEEIIRKRLLIDGDGTGDDRRLNILIKAITKWPEITDDTPEERQVTLDKMLNQLCSCEFALRKSLVLSKTATKQLQKYKILQQKLEEKTSVGSSLMGTCKNLLAQAKVLKQNCIVYNLIAQSIEKFPTREDTNKSVDNLKKELNELQSEKKSLEEKLNLRRKQFYVLVSSANSLHAMLEESSDDGMNSLVDGITNSPGPEVEPMSE